MSPLYLTLLISFFIPGMAGGFNMFLAIAECSAGKQPALQHRRRARHSTRHGREHPPALGSVPCAAPPMSLLAP